MATNNPFETGTFGGQHTDPNEPVWAQQTMQPAMSSSAHNPGGSGSSAFKSVPGSGGTHFYFNVLRVLNIGIAVFYVATGTHLSPLCMCLLSRLAHQRSNLITGVLGFSNLSKSKWPNFFGG